MLVVGNREAEDQTVAVRQHGQGAQETVPVDDFIRRIKDEIDAMIDPAD
jgi:threonyl-tRNA synthetase